MFCTTLSLSAPHQNFFQSPTPPTTQIMGNGQNSNGIFPSSKPEEWIALTPDGMHVVDHSDSLTPWMPWSYTGYPSTGWGNDAFKAISYSTMAGNRAADNPKPRSTMQVGYTSFIFTEDSTVGDNQFFIASPEWAMYFIPGCPNYEAGASLYDPRQCPRKKFKKGEFKVCGMITSPVIVSV